MTSHMPNLSSKKAQFFILTTVVIVGVFYSLSKSIDPYTFVDTSSAAYGEEILFFDNVKDKSIKTVRISDSGELLSNLEEYKIFIEEVASERGYNLVFYYTNTTDTVKIDMALTSQKYTLRANFTIPRP